MSRVEERGVALPIGDRGVEDLLDPQPHPFASLGSALLGRSIHDRLDVLDADVIRESSIISGDRCCVYRIEPTRD